MADLAQRLRDAATRGDVAAIAALIASGTDPNARNIAGNAPLHFVASAGQANAVRTLIEAGADRGATNTYGGATPR